MSRAVSSSESCAVSREIGAYIAAAHRRPLPPEVAEKTKLHLLDSLAAILSGSRLKPGLFAARFAQALGGPEEAQVLGTGIRVSAINAALANGMAAHADETDDSHLRSRAHLGCAVVPAALALAERNGRSGRELMNAVALGYDIGARSTMALGYGPAKTQKHSTHSIAATFGASAAAGTLIHPSTEQAVFILSFAAQQASGVPSWNRDSEHVEKAFDFGGMGARNGVFGALIVEAGASGVSDPMIGRHSFLDGFAEKPDEAELTRGLGAEFEVMQASIKKWCVGSPIQAALDSLVYLMEQHTIGADDVEAITAIMPDDRLHVVSDAAISDICLQYLLAVTLIDGTLTFVSSHDEARMHDPAVLAMRARIRAVPSPELTVARPARQAIIELHLKNGTTVSRRTHAVLGTPDNPMSPQEVVAKAEDLVAPVIGQGRARELSARIMDIESCTDVRELRPLFA